MSKVFVDISMSLDGFVAGPGRRLEEPLGAGGERLHEWAFAALSWREQHGRSGGEAGLDSDVIEEGVPAAGALRRRGRPRATATCTWRAARSSARACSSRRRASPTCATASSADTRVQSWSWS